MQNQGWATSGAYAMNINAMTVTCRRFNEYKIDSFQIDYGFVNSMKIWWCERAIL